MSAYLMQARSSTTGLIYCWTMTAPDFAGAGYPGPGSPLDVAIVCDNITSKANAPVVRHSLANFPVAPTALYQFDGDLTDASGNGYTLVGAGSPTGVAAFTDLFPGVRGFVNVSQRIESADAIFRTATGDMTFMTLLRPSAVPTDTGDIHAQGDAIAEQSGGVDDTSGSTPNYLWGLSLQPTSIRYFHEHGAGSDEHYSISYSVPLWRVSHLTFTRISNVIQFYLNGVATGSPSSALPPPDGGSGSTLLMGSSRTIAGSSLTPFKGVLCSTAIWLGTGLSAAQIKAQFNYTMGARYPEA